MGCDISFVDVVQITRESHIEQGPMQHLVAKTGRKRTTRLHTQVSFKITWKDNRQLYPRYPFYRGLGGAPGPVWTIVENLAPKGIPSPDRPGSSELRICSCYTRRMLSLPADLMPCLNALLNFFCPSTHLAFPAIFCPLIGQATPPANGESEKF